MGTLIRELKYMSNMNASKNGELAEKNTNRCSLFWGIGLGHKVH